MRGPSFNGMGECPNVLYFAMSWMDLHWYFVETRKFLFACRAFFSFAGRDGLQRSIDSNISFDGDGIG